MYCVTVDNSSPFGRFHKLIEDSDIIDTDINKRIVATVDYSDLIYKPQTVYNYYKNITTRTTVVLPDNTTQTVTTVEQVARLIPGVLLGSKVDGWAQYFNRWTISGPDMYGNCNNMEGIKWLIPSTPGPCSRTIIASNLPSLCISDLNAKYFYELLEIIPGKTAETTTAVVLNSVYRRNLDTNELTLTTLLDVQTQYTGCDCLNALLEAHYTVETTSSQLEINKITVDIIIADIDLESCTTTDIITIPQDFSVNFITSSLSESKKSGNPGYLLGKPIRTGSLETTVISLNQDGFWFYGASSTGSCTSTSINFGNNPTLNFGRDAIYNCYLDFTFAQLSSACQISNAELTIFSSHDFTHVGKYGDANVEVLSD